MTVVISGFPCIGKTTCCEKFKEKGMIKFLDSDSSSFSWLEGEPKRRNPEFPGNYINHLKECIDSGNYDIIFVSTHDVVRKAMRKNGIAYTLAYPSIDMLPEYVGRAYIRGSGTAFCDTMIEHWDEWIKSCMNDPTLTSIVLTGRKPYLYDIIINRFGSQFMLKNI